jgi:beta-carotene 3-hydroxylase
MEGVAWATHKYVMHGFLWVLHKDHHRPKGRGLQRNDAFALFFATVSILLILNGLNHGWGPMAAAGFGMALYGVGYTVFHDIMFHRRIPGLRYRPKSGYMKRIVRAHRAHHRHPHKSPSESFSFLYAPRKYARSEAL